MFADTGIPRLLEAVQGARRAARPHGGAPGRRRAGDGQSGYLPDRQAQLPGGAQDLVESGNSNCTRKRWAVGCREPHGWRWASGRMWIREGGGTDCELASRDASAKAPQRTREKTPRKRWKGRSEMAYSVLIVDDSPVMRSFIRRVMRSVGLRAGRMLGGVERRGGLASCGTRRRRNPDRHQHAEDERRGIARGAW